MEFPPQATHVKAATITTGDIWIIILVWCASLVLINPIGNFPLNDDWSFALTVKHFIDSGDYRPLGWASMPFITNALWGSLFCLVAGFSFNVLRFSTLCLSLLGLFSFCLLAKNLRLNRSTICIAALTLAFDPLYYVLSNTFMTDVPYTTMQTLAALFFVRCLKSNSNRDLLIGTLLAIAATLSRKLAIAIPLSFSIVFIFKYGAGFRNMIRPAISCLACLGALLVFEYWLSATHRAPLLYYKKNAELIYMLTHPNLLFMVAMANIYRIWLYLGLFLLPVSLSVLPTIKITRKNFAIPFSIYTVLALLFIVWHGLYYGKFALPLLENIIVKAGIGPLTLQDTYILSMHGIPELPYHFWLALTFIGIFGAILLATIATHCALHLARGFQRKEISDTEVAGAFLLLSAIIYLLPTLPGMIFDRYLVPAIPLLAVGILASVPRTEQSRTNIAQRSAVIFSVIALAIFSICGTRDYFLWNRIRWMALRDLSLNQHVDAKEIDGGLEFNGLFLYNDSYVPRSMKSWWWVEQDNYVLSFQELLGYSIFKQYDYRGWLPPADRKILVLKKATE